MIEWKVDLGDKEGSATLITHGNLPIVLAEITLSINRLYNNLMRDDEAVAGVFRKIFTECIIDPEAPMWQVRELHGETVVNTAVLRELAEKRKTPDHEEDS